VKHNGRRMRRTIGFSLKNLKIFLFIACGQGARITAESPISNVRRRKQTRRAKAYDQDEVSSDRKGKRQRRWSSTDGSSRAAGNKRGRVSHQQDIRRRDKDTHSHVGRGEV
jgi:hypothetical protein